MKKLRWLAILMGITILGITGFQGYWLKNNYDREKQNLEIKSNTDFRQTILRLQSSKLKLDKLSIQFDSAFGPLKGRLMMEPRQRQKQADSLSVSRREPPITVINLLEERARQLGDSGRKKAFIISNGNSKIRSIYIDSTTGEAKGLQNRMESITVSGDSLPGFGTVREIKMNAHAKEDTLITLRYGNNRKSPDSLVRGNVNGIFIGEPPHLTFEDKITEHFPEPPQKNPLFKFLYSVDSLSLGDSVTIQEITDAYSKRLKEEKMNGLSFAVKRLDSAQADTQNPNQLTIGFTKPVTYGLLLQNKTVYLLKKITLPILFSLFLVGITVVSFVLLYRNLVKQKRLAELKNEFISNITHELKTPIATVGVAIEALKNFNAIHDPQRTKEYLDISQNELQRLSLLVDKVLKLSMFEKKEIELRKEQFDCRQLTEEVMNSMKLQFEKYHAKIKLHTEGENFVVEADKLHITSVIYNLLDNALKYSRENPVIEVQLKALPEYIQFSVSDNGIGIPHAYKEKIFDKFFRVPTGDKHNIKGYGLGLSYVSEVIRRHHGNVQVESELGKGSTFTARFPYV